MRFHDRLYGRLELPPLAQDLAEHCPVLLRLREVRMPNIPFASYPSFANVSRFEHSLGVAHLAWRFARDQELPEDEAIALTLAGLYHDGASPAFGHLYEELLIPGGFDHEKALVQLLTGKTELPGRANHQVFLGRSCRLPRKVPRVDQSSVLSAHGVSEILAGSHRLSPVIVGSLDLDNIDNVIRAATAMGLETIESSVHPYEVARELTIEDDRLCRAVDGGPGITTWQEVRKTLYTAILDNAFEFRAQSAIKWAISEAAAANPELSKESSWTLTETELVFEHLRKHDQAKSLIDSVRLGSPPTLLLRAAVEDVSPLLSHDSIERVDEFREEAGSLLRKSLFVNFYVDKRDRAITLPRAMRQVRLTATGRESAPTATSGSLPGVVGVFERSVEDLDYGRQRYGPSLPSRHVLEDLLAEKLSLEISTETDPAGTSITAQAQLPLAG